MRTAKRLIAVLALALTGPLAWAAAPLEQGFADPPDSAKVRVYWWWLNSNVTNAAITRDLQEMRAKGIGGALIFDAGGPAGPTPAGPAFLSPEWRELYKHALREADRLGIELSLSIQSGWNLGGPTVKPEEAFKRVVWSEITATGPAKFAKPLPQPKANLGFYRDIAVLAYRLDDGGAKRAENPFSGGKNLASAAKAARPIRMLDIKTSSREFGGSAPDTSPLLADDPDQPGEEDLRAKDVLDLTGNLDKDGNLRWDVPEGSWQVLRFGYTITGAKVSTSSPGWSGLALEYLDSDSLRSYWKQVVDPLIADAGPLAGKSLKYFHTDSWECGGVNWTANFAEEFRKRRGYDLRPYLPVLAGRIVDSRSASNRFLNDFRKTIGDCVADNHYRLFAEMSHLHGIGIHPESGGPHGAPVDALKCLGRSDIPMMEFWARAKTHRVREEDRLFVKQAACAAHIYGKRIVAAEAFTTIAPHWQETLWDNLKPTFDQEACEGLNRAVVHQFTCSPPEMGVPGQEYFAGTHFNPQLSWWKYAGAFTAYLNRCQFLLQQGLFVADVCYYYGDHVPNFVQLKGSDPARIQPGYDYDVCNAEVLLTRLAAADGRLTLPDGMSYRVLVLPDRKAMPLEVLCKLKDLVEAGATVIGPRPEEDTGLTNFPQCDEEIRKIAAELWADCDGQAVKEHRAGKGRIVWGKTAREVLAADGVKSDFEFSAAQAGAFLDYIHRRDAGVDIYFVVNRLGRPEEARCTFRVSGKAPELWGPLTGRIRDAAAFKQADGRTTLPLEFSPFGSLFVVFRRPIPPSAAGTASCNFPVFSGPHEIAGPWTVKFDPKWGGPESVEFAHLENWTKRPEAGIRYYSGAAVYRKVFDLPESLRQPASRVMLDLGDVRQIAAVRLNGRDLGVLWAMPMRVDVTEAVRPTANELEIEVTNFWPNRLIGDAALPLEKRLTRTTVALKADTPLLDSGLLGPVVLQSAQSP